MRAGVGGDESFDASKNALDGNSADLQGAVAAAYGDTAGSAFRKLWNAHIAAYLAYINATKAANTSAQTTATTQIDDYVAQLSGFLAGANPYLDAGAVADLFRHHAQQLTSQVQSYGAKDYAKTYQTVRELYSHMFTAGEALATGIAQQLPDKFPATAGAPATDALPGEHAHASAPPAAILMVASGLAAGALMTIVLLGADRRRREMSRVSGPRRTRGA